MTVKGDVKGWMIYRDRISAQDIPSERIKRLEIYGKSG
jgi:hypothetical protein